VRVRVWTWGRFLLSISSWDVSGGMEWWRWGGWTCVEAGDGPGLFAGGSYVAFVAALYPIAVLKAYPL
jgi:hypothetical protein